MENLLEKVAFRRYWLWPIWILGATIASYALLYFVKDPDGRSIITGIIGGLVVWLATFFSQVVTMQRLQHYLDTGIVDLRVDRHDKAYYSCILRDASSYVHVTGSSASRFIEDFLRHEAGDHMLLDRLRQVQGLSVKLLIPRRAAMDSESVNKFENVRSIVDRLQDDFPSRFEIRYFDTNPFMSFVLTEKDFVGGPILPKVRSRDTAALHVKAKTRYAQNHKQFFDELWKEAGLSYDG